MKKPEGKCAIFLDIDGTITYKSPVPSDVVIDTLKKVMEKGHKVFINTGRGRGFIHEKLLQVLPHDGVICGMGGHIEMDGKVIRSVCIKREDVDRVLSLAFAKGYSGYFEGVNAIYSIRGGNCDGWDIKVSDVPEITEAEKDTVLKLSIMGTMAKEDVDFLSDTLTIYQHPTYAESSVKGYNKATAMLDVLEMLNIPIENSIAIGDSTNDEAMLKAAGIGVAMGNSPDEIKEMADFVTLSNAENGAAVALEKLLDL